MPKAAFPSNTLSAPTDVPQAGAAAAGQPPPYRRPAPPPPADYGAPPPAPPSLLPMSPPGDAAAAAAATAATPRSIRHSDLVAVVSEDCQHIHLRRAADYSAEGCAELFDPPTQPSSSLPAADADAGADATAAAAEEGEEQPPWRRTASNAPDAKRARRGDAEARVGTPRSLAAFRDSASLTHRAWRLPEGGGGGGGDAAAASEPAGLPSPAEGVAALAGEVTQYLTGTFDGAFDHTAERRTWLRLAMLDLAKAAVALNRGDPRRRGAVVELAGSHCMLGDIHGDFEDLSFFMSHLTLMDDVRLSPHGFLFLGDYVDRGRWGVEVTAYVLALRCLAPEKVTMLRGNHDDPSVNGAVSDYAQQSFRYQCALFANRSKKDGDDLHVACNKAFKSFPLAAIVDRRLFCSHGGIPRHRGGPDDRLATLMDPAFPEIPVVHPRHLDPLTATPAQKQMLYAWDLMWADPDPARSASCAVDDDADAAAASDDEEQADLQHGFGPNVRGGSTVSYSARALRTFLRSGGLECLVRGHQECLSGVQVSQGGQLLTVFSTSGYCNHTNSAGAAVYHAMDRTLHYVTKRI